MVDNPGITIKFTIMIDELRCLRHVMSRYFIRDCIIYGATSRMAQHRLSMRVDDWAAVNPSHALLAYKASQCCDEMARYLEALEERTEKVDKVYHSHNLIRSDWKKSIKSLLAQSSYHVYVK